ncbi:MAG: CpsB/CapC family capsule biosynthesis tyrosine phosphatase [Candidatus Marinimicrobia bacterium]|nr:CpsB/CapC family capsule biosynthesis tyrosine phosphatase [Candidatus Neomarinimicrobiota bacterium]
MQNLDKIYDFHNHIVYGVDDGSDSLEKSIKMLRQAADQGVTNVVCTPHQFETDEPRILSERQKTIVERFNILKEKVKEKNIPIELSLGSEIMFFKDVKKYLKNPYFTINNNKYVLIEFHLMGPPIEFVDVFYDLIVAGYVPILAHPERIAGLYDERRSLIKLLKMGVLFQINTGSILGLLGKGAQESSKKYLENNWIHLLGSDAHSLNFRRGFSMQQGIEYISKNYPHINLKEILEVNPKAVINGEHVEVDISDIKIRVKSPKSNLKKLLNKIIKKTKKII